jgi:MoaA/NifB/PqqE/SkfB family radical SAM enzyme
MKLKYVYQPFTNMLKEIVPKWRYIDFCPSWACDARCPTCSAWKRDTYSLPYEKAMVIANSFPDCETFIIEGGEPTMWPHFTEFMQVFYNNHKKCEITVITNGIDTEGILEKVKDFSRNINFLVSFNGVGDDMHSKSRGVNGATEKTLYTAVELKNLGFHVALSFTPFKENMSNYYEVKNMCRINKFGFSMCYPVKSAKFGEKGIKWNFLDADEKDELFYDFISSKTGFHKLTYRILYDSIKAKKMIPCLAGKSAIHITPQGIIRPCHIDESRRIGIVTDNTVFIDRDVYKDIPESCEYANGDLCVDCYVHHSIARSPFYLLRNL